MLLVPLLTGSWDSLNKELNLQFVFSSRLITIFLLWTRYLSVFSFYRWISDLTSIAGFRRLLLFRLPHRLSSFDSSVKSPIRDEETSGIFIFLFDLVSISFIACVLPILQFVGHYLIWGTNEKREISFYLIIRFVAIKLLRF